MNISYQNLIFNRLIASTRTSLMQLHQRLKVLGIQSRNHTAFNSKILLWIHRQYTRQYGDVNYDVDCEECFKWKGWEPLVFMDYFLISFPSPDFRWTFSTLIADTEGVADHWLASHQLLLNIWQKTFNPAFTSSHIPKGTDGPWGTIIFWPQYRYMQKSNTISNKVSWPENFPLAIKFLRKML